jgi:hypothetical protein
MSDTRNKPLAAAVADAIGVTELGNDLMWDLHVTTHAWAKLAAGDIDTLADVDAMTDATNSVAASLVRVATFVQMIEEGRQLAAGGAA